MVHFEAKFAGSKFFIRVYGKYEKCKRARNHT